MAVQDSIKADLKTALLSKNQELTGVLRLLSAALINEAIAQKKKDAGLTAEEAIAVLKREAKKRKDSITQFEAGGRQDLADKEKAELAVITKYLPAAMGEDEIRQVVAEVIASLGAVNPNQFGQVMGSVMGKLKGQADGGVVSKVVKEEINK